MKSVVPYVKKIKTCNFHHWTNKIKNKHTWISCKIFVFYRKWEIKNSVVFDVGSATPLETFWIKQGMPFFAHLQCFRHVQRHACVIACLICWSLCSTDKFTWTNIISEFTWKSRTGTNSFKGRYKINFTMVCSILHNYKQTHGKVMWGDLPILNWKWCWAQTILRRVMYFYWY